MRTSSIRHRANARLAILFEDFLEICEGNMLAAMLLAILVYWTDIKINKKDTNLWVWKSHQDFQEDLMFDKPGMKPPHRTTIKAALDLLEKKDFTEKRKNPKMPLDQTKQYLVHLDIVQAAIDALPPIVVKPTMQRRNNDNATSNNQQSLSENQQCNVEIPTSNTNDYITEITTPEITEDGIVVSAIAENDAPAATIHDLQKWKEESGKHKAVTLSDSQVDIGNFEGVDEEDFEGETQKMPAMPKGASNADTVLPATHRVPASSAGDHDGHGLVASRHEPVEFSDPGPGVGATPARRSGHADSLPPVSTNGAAQGGKRTKVTQATLKSPEELAIDERCRALQQRINDWRGYDLKGESKGKIINEHKSIRTLVETYSDEQIEQIYLYLFNRHWRWSKPDSRYNIGAYVILSEAKGVMMELKAPKQNGKATSKPDAYGNDYSLTALLARQQKAM